MQEWSLQVPYIITSVAGLATMLGLHTTSPCYHGPYLSALAMGSSHNRALYKSPITLLYSYI